MVKISVITVVYNNEATIERAICSVLEQNHPNIEYIVVDGGSTDNTLNIINKYSDQIDVIISEKDNGLYDAMNKGVKKATGDVVGILNSDDTYYDKDSLSSVGKAFKMYNTDSIYADVIIVKENKQDSIVRYYSAKSFKLWHFRFGHMPGHASFFVKRKYFDIYGLYDTCFKISADFDLVFRFLYINKLSYKYIPKILVRMSLGGVSTQGYSSIKQMNKELKHIFKKNNIKSNIIMIYMKYFAKIFQYLYKPF